MPYRNARVPPIVALGYALLAKGLEKLWPLPAVPLPDKVPLGDVLAVLGAALIAWSAWTFSRRGTDLDPGRPAKALVTSRPFRFSRNPVYLGLILVVLGVSFTNTWSLILAIPAALVFQHFVIRHEEARLEAQFGDGYRQYRAKVRRWL